MKQLLMMMKAVPWWVYVAALSALSVQYIEFEAEKQEEEQIKKDYPAIVKQPDTYDYIKLYKSIAVEEMKRSGIPASITLAQGILESQHGESELATEANNHFGIKCGEDWDGNRYTKQSGEWNSEKNAIEPCLSCFRWYSNPEESFKDHSTFLVNRERYQHLFDLDKEDYKAWAEGLRLSGYATDPKYAVKLIAIVEKYGLDRYDKEVTKDFVNW